MDKTYTIIYNGCEGKAVFTVDTEKFTAEIAKQTLEFFTWDYDSDADPIAEVMKKYGMAAIKEATFGNWNTQGVISQFDNKEGFYPIDGTCGVKLINVEGYEFYDEDIELSISPTH